MIGYHGTSLEFDRFSFDFAGSGSNGGSGTDEGIFIAEDRDHAEYWARHSSRSTGENPMLLTVEFEAHAILEFNVREFIESDHEMAGDPIAFAIGLARGSYDAIRFTNSLDIPDSGELSYWFIFDPAAIKITRRDSI